MAERKLTMLVPGMQRQTQRVIGLCRKRGVDLLVYCTQRGLEEQARLYRSTRTRQQIEDKCENLKIRGYGFLADILERVGPQPGPLGSHRTNAAPGESFHNYGLAVDAVVTKDGKPDWNMHYPDLWKIYGQCVSEAGLSWAGEWEKFKEFVHFQAGAGSNPLRYYHPDEAREILEKAGSFSHR